MALQRGDGHITQDMRDNPEKYVPEGMYCYSSTGESGVNAEGIPYRKVQKCPFWDYDPDMPNQENGYCHFLREGDWGINIDGMDTTTLEHCPDHPELEGKTQRELALIEDCPIPILNVSLLWDQCKECGINDEWEDEDE